MQVIVSPTPSWFPKPSSKCACRNTKIDSFPFIAKHHLFGFQISNFFAQSLAKEIQLTSAKPMTFLKINWTIAVCFWKKTLHLVLLYEAGSIDCQLSASYWWPPLSGCPQGDHVAESNPDFGWAPSCKLVYNPHYFFCSTTKPSCRSNSQSIADGMIQWSNHDRICVFGGWNHPFNDRSLWLTPKLAS